MFSDFSHKVSLTIDAWTSTTTNQGYLGITAHWIDDKEFSLGKKVLAMTTDNGSNMDFMHLRCGAYVLNLAVKEGIKLIDQPIEKLRKTAGKELKTIFEMKNQKFLIPDLDITTKWNSLYNMIKKMLRIKDMVDILIAGNRIVFHNRMLLQIYPSKEEWDDIKKIGIDPPTTQSLIATAIVIKLDNYWKLLDQNSKISSILHTSY
ncbi:2943_t:CDS:2 [Entrophospora sp. SA101]|nr:2943_t:CDS:2 [Entrophospora sp. SA101]